MDGNVNSPAPQPLAGHVQRVMGSLSWTLAGEVLFAAGQFGILVVMARMGSEQALGQYGLGLAIATPLLVITSLHLRPTYVVANDDELVFGDYLGLRLIGAPLALVLACIWSLVADHDPDTFAMVAFVTLTRVSELVSDMLHGAAGRAEELQRVGIGRALRGVLLLLSTILALWLGSTPVAAIGYSAIVGMAITVVYDLPTARRHVDVRPRYSWRHAVDLVKLAAPVGIAGGLMALNRNAPAYVIEQVDGL